MTIKNLVSPSVQAASLLLLGLLLLDLMSATAKVLRAEYPAGEISLARNVFAFIPLIGFFYMENRRWVKLGELRIVQWRLALFRGLLVASAQFCLYGALGHLELATAITIAYAGPFFITMLSVVVLNERVGIWRWSVVGVGLIGVLLVIRPGSDLFSWWALLPLCAAVLYALSLVLSRRFEPGLSNAVVNLYSLIGAITGSLVLVVIQTAGAGRALPFDPSMSEMLLAVLTGLFGGCGVYCLTKGFRLGEASFLAPFEYFGIFTSLVLGWYVFGEWPVAQLFPGVLLIVGAGILIIIRGNRQKT